MILSNCPSSWLPSKTPCLLASQCSNSIELLLAWLTTSICQTKDNFPVKAEGEDMGAMLGCAVFQKPHLLTVEKRAQRAGLVIICKYLYGSQHLLGMMGLVQPRWRVSGLGSWVWERAQGCCGRRGQGDDTEMFLCLENGGLFWYRSQIPWVPILLICLLLELLLQNFKALFVLKSDYHFAKDLFCLFLPVCVIDLNATLTVALPGITVFLSHCSSLVGVGGLLLLFWQSICLWLVTGFPDDRSCCHQQCQ